MLGLHQAVGIGTLSAMALTSVVGLLNYQDLYNGGDRTGNYRWPHRILVGVTLVGFASTAGLSLLAPEPYEKEQHGVDQATIHKSFAALASLGMLTQMSLGFWTARQAAAGNPYGLRQKATIHRYVAYGTLAALSGAALTWVF